jgi:succinate-semialdehyde dehydrogenase / glutarate-semialdehyde dehydrogenase
MASLLSSNVKDKSLVVASGLVAGEWREGKRKFPVTEPSSNTTLLECADLEQQDFIDAIQSAKVGTRDFYESTTAKDRGNLLRKWHDLISANASDSTYTQSSMNIVYTKNVS